MNGDYKTYHQNGYLQSKGKYKQGKKQGMTLYYSSTRSNYFIRKLIMIKIQELQSLLISYYVDKKTEEIIGIWKEEEMKGRVSMGLAVSIIRAEIYCLKLNTLMIRKMDSPHIILKLFIWWFINIRRIYMKTMF